MAKRRMLTRKPHFFQPLLPGFERKLSIPVAFLKYLEGKASDKPAQLRGRGGKVWPVKIKGRTFGDGWGEFVGDHDLHVGDFLVFKLEGDLMFDVMVLDHTACQKEYGCLGVEEPVLKIERQNLEEEHAGRDSKRSSKSMLLCNDICEFISLVSMLLLFRFFYHISFHQDQIMFQVPGVIFFDIENEDSPVKLEEDEMLDVMVLDHTACVEECDCLGVEEPILKIEQQNLEDDPRGRNSKRKAIVSEKFAKNMIPGSSTLRRPYFEATVTHYGIVRSRQYIPKIFARHLSERSCQAIVMDQRGRSWPVTLIRRKFDLQSYFGGGWKDFCHGNDIKKGDTIILELVKTGMKPTLQLIRHSIGRTGAHKRRKTAAAK